MTEMDPDSFRKGIIDILALFPVIPKDKFLLQCL